jgi:tetratricopeptide (TPR) repeat protein
MSLFGKPVIELYNEGVSLAQGGKYTDALKKYCKVLRKNVNFLEAYVSQADVMSRLGRYEESLKSLDKAFKYRLKHY